VIIKGSFVLKNYVSEKTDYLKIRETNKHLSSLILSLGRYQELKENFKMRERVKEISLGSNSHKKKEDSLKHSHYETEVYIESELTPDSDFRIIGSHKPDFFNPDLEDENINSEDTGWKEEYSDIVKEISDFNNGFSIFDNIELNQSAIDLKAQNEDPLSAARREVKIPSKRLFFDDSGGESNIVEDYITPINTKNVQEAPKKPKEVVFNKNKLKFGFDEEHN